MPIGLWRCFSALLRESLHPGYSGAAKPDLAHRKEFTNSLKQSLWYSTGPGRTSRGGQL